MDLGAPPNRQLRFRSTAYPLYEWKGCGAVDFISSHYSLSVTIVLIKPLRKNNLDEYGPP